MRIVMLTLKMFVVNDLDENSMFLNLKASLKDN